ncbi:serine/threonine-protein kinase [Pseudactinotalea terrae]|uniref:serine/threonine-protein kinase n=1 Tax=Pseudactinotalea terrae TaxID=1743262 RepID=UPI0012E28540|nr:serine/threonine-protein kinase [Pseudactinotalea terrae]
MVKKRPPAPPPEIPGFEFIRLLGSGGFSDVFLYEQELPRRRVAVKVLLAQASGETARQQFVAEANLMAQLSTHPSIVTIYHADTAADGRPYLMMEYCPRPNMSVRYRSERIAVAEAIRIGIRLAGAVETAHRIGILHRDIKPANVLTTDYGWPALTDFGISVVSTATPGGEAVGMSIPWAAPEFFADDAVRGVGGDIYSLGATVYTLLKGASPFEDPDGPNSALDLITRIERSAVPPIGRPDAPASLESVLVRAMAKRPEGRYPSAASFGRALQRVEQEMQLSQTSLDLPDTSWAQTEGSEDTDDLRTRARMVTTVQQGMVSDSSVPPPISAPPPGPAGPAAPPPQPNGEEPEKRRRWPALLASLAVVAVIVVVVIIGALNSPDVPINETSTTPAPTEEIPTDTLEIPPPPVGLEGERSPGGPIRFTWAAPEWEGELTYIWRIQGEQNTERTVGGTTLDVDDPGTVCVEVASVTDRGSLSEYASACAG